MGGAWGMGGTPFPSGMGGACGMGGGGGGPMGSALARPCAPAKVAKPMAAADAVVTINLLIFMRCPSESDFLVGFPNRLSGSALIRTSRATIQRTRPLRGMRGSGRAHGPGPRTKTARYSGIQTPRNQNPHWLNPGSQAGVTVWPQ